MKAKIEIKPVKSSARLQYALHGKLVSLTEAELAIVLETFLVQNISFLQDLPYFLPILECFIRWDNVRNYASRSYRIYPSSSCNVSLKGSPACIVLGEKYLPILSLDTVRIEQDSNKGVHLIERFIAITPEIRWRIIEREVCEVQVEYSAGVVTKSYCIKGITLFQAREILKQPAVAREAIRRLVDTLGDAEEYLEDASKKFGRIHAEFSSVLDRVAD